MKSYPQVAARLFGTPLLLVPEKAETIASVLAERLHLAPMIDVDACEGPRIRAVLDGDATDRRPYATVDGVAVIAIVGELVNRGSWLDALSGLTSYESVASDLAAALADPDVSGIALDIDSPGGEAAGAMETAALIRAASAIKPVTAFVNGMAASAGYALASGAPRIVVAPSATLGSIGVVLLHLDRSAKMERDGLKPTLIKKGAYKTDGSSLAPLDAGAQARIDGLLDVVYGLFASTVAAHRPALNFDAVKATEAGLYIGQQAIDAGLADEVGTLTDVVRSMAPAPRNTGPLGLKGPDMTDITKADHDAAIAQAKADAASAAQARISGILGHAEAAGRGAQANHLAFKTAMSVEDAGALMAASAKEAPAAGGQRGPKLDGRVPAPAVEPDAEGDGNGDGATGPDDDYAKGAAAARAALGIR